jgi:hypothetical protein
MARLVDGARACIPGDGMNPELEHRVRRKTT